MTTHVLPAPTASGPAPIPNPPPPTARRRGRGKLLAWVTAILVLAGVGGAVAMNPRARAAALDALKHVSGLTPRVAHEAAGGATRPEPEPGPSAPWDGTVAVDDRQREALGIEVVPVEAQARPLRIDINGSTAYDPDSLVQIRPKFLGRVDKVHVRLGQRVEPGQPLIDLYSSDLAEAKLTFEERQSQSEKEQAEYVRTEALFKQGAKPEKALIQDRNEAFKAKQESQIARDRLLNFYGLTEAQIDAIARQPRADRPKLTLRAESGGTIIKRDVVPGNNYDIGSVLLVIAPLDKFWVWGNVYPSDAPFVRVGQAWDVHCATLGVELRRQVEVVTPQVDPDTKTIRIRTTIDNDSGAIRDGMLISGTVEVAPPAGATAIPRVALVTADGATFAFVERPGTPGRFERRPIVVAREGDRRVVILEGLKPGERVVARGSLIVGQMYEDAATSDGGRTD